VHLGFTSLERTHAETPCPAHLFSHVWRSHLPTSLGGTKI